LTATCKSLLSFLNFRSPFLPSPKLPTNPLLPPPLQRHLEAQSLRRRALATSLHQPRHVLLPRVARRPTRQRLQHPRRDPHDAVRALGLRERRLLRLRDRRGPRDRHDRHRGHHHEDPRARRDQEARLPQHRHRHLGSGLYVPHLSPSFFISLPHRPRKRTL